jgi:hypothetical protein
MIPLTETLVLTLLSSSIKSSTFPSEEFRKLILLSVNDFRRGSYAGKLEVSLKVSMNRQEALKARPLVQRML